MSTPDPRVEAERLLDAAMIRAADPEARRVLGEALAKAREAANDETLPPDVRAQALELLMRDNIMLLAEVCEEG